MTGLARSVTVPLVRRAHRLLLVGPALALSACATTPREPLVYLSLAGSAPCTVDVDDRRYTLPADAAALARQTRRLATRTQGAIVDSGAEPLSFACWRAAMAIVRRAGFARLGLVTEAPPEPAPQPPPADPPKPRRTPA